MAFRDLQEAYELADSEAVRKRVGDYVKYVQYLRLYHTYSHADVNGKDAKIAATKDLLKHMWRIYPSAMVHTYRMGQLIHRRVPETRPYLNAKDRNEEEWAAITVPTEDELHQWVEQGVADYPDLKIQRVEYTGELQPLQTNIAAEEGAKNKTYSQINSVKVYFHVPASRKTLPVEFGVRNWIEGRKVEVVMFDPDEQEVFRQVFVVPARSVPHEKHELPIPTAKPGIYRFEVHDPTNGYHFAGPADVPMVVPGPISSLGWLNAYFYVPKGLKKLAMIHPARQGTEAFVRPPEGEKIILDNSYSLHVIDVPAGMDGKVWSLRSASGRIFPLNAPNYFSMTPETMMIPADAR